MLRLSLRFVSSRLRSPRSIPIRPSRRSLRDLPAICSTRSSALMPFLLRTLMRSVIGASRLLTALPRPLLSRNAASFGRAAVRVSNGAAVTSLRKSTIGLRTVSYTHLSGTF